MASEPTPDPAAAGGEEWRDLDLGPQSYRPESYDDFLRTARNRIQDVRTSECELRLVDRRGRPLAGEPVRIEQLGHAFPFGDQVWPLDAMHRHGEWETDRARAWRRRFAEVFNASTNLCYWTERPRNDASKTEEAQGEPRLENFAATVEWSLATGLTPKGHPLFWSIPKCVPDWVHRYDPATRMRFAEVRVRNLVARFRGRVRIWDAVNEPLWEATLGNLERRQWPHLEPIESIAAMVADVLRWCREEDPDALYLINDYGMEQDQGRHLQGNDGSTVTAASQRRRFAALIRRLGELGQAPDAIGLQSHTGWMDHPRQWAVYDEFSSTGLPVHVTEFWAQTRELEQSGRYSEEAVNDLVTEYAANYLTTAFAHPGVEGFFFWGFMEKAIRWGERSGHEPRRLFHRIRSLLREEWRTRLESRTDDQGVVRFRGFHGRYAVRRLRGPLGIAGRTFDLAKGREGALTIEWPRVEGGGAP
ncbi:MAG: hypothetical protein EA425_02195 [Puniceicoccaceae bacterium]|nr:MAG: hypothetical protein EA425_02195 [Puniceicoccaceae bacterium]